jgi:hypothetical protein
MHLDRVRILDEAGAERTKFRAGEPFVVEVDCRRVGGDRKLGMTISIRRADGLLLASARSLEHDVPVGVVHGTGRVRCRFGGLPFPGGIYPVDVLIERDDDTIMGEEIGAATLRIESSAPVGEEIVSVEHGWDVEWKANVEAPNR